MRGRRGRDDLSHWHGGQVHLLFSLRSGGAYKERAHAARNVERAEPGTAQHPRETEGKAVAAVHDELEADEEPREYAHDEHGCRPRGPCDGAEEGDEREDCDEERNEGQARGEREEEVRAVDVQRERLGRGVVRVFLLWLRRRRLTWNLRTSAPE